LAEPISPTSATARGSVSRPHEAMLSAATVATTASLTRGPAPLTIVPIIAVAAVGGRRAAAAPAGNFHRIGFLWRQV
jgi:hypothetical protein